MSDASAIREARGDDIPRLAPLLARAFAADPFHRWLFPDESRRAARQLRLFERVLGIYSRYGRVFTNREMTGAALWDPPRIGGPTLGETLAFVFQVLPVFGWRARRVAQGMAPMASLHPGTPHWYLSVLGTDPLARGRGIGRSLLLPVLRQCDEDGLEAYLEASRIENVGYYERFGFRLVSPLSMPGGPSVYRMVRRPGDRGEGEA